MSDDNLDWLEEDFGLDEESDRTVEPVARELLTLKLLREAIQHQNPGDVVMQEFAEIVLPNLLKYTVGVTAKGGKFFAEYLDRVVNPQRIAAGKAPIRRDNAADQSLNTHLLNGLNNGWATVYADLGEAPTRLKPSQGLKREYG